MINNKILENTVFKIDEKFKYNGKHYTLGKARNSMNRYFTVYCYEDKKTIVSRGLLQTCINKIKSN